MSRLPTIAFVFVAASVVLTVSIERRARLRQLAQSQLFDSQAAQLNQFNADNESLSNRVVADSPQAPLIGHDLAELLQLRNEATRLREFTAGKPRLEAANAKLRNQSAIGKSPTE